MTPDSSVVIAAFSSWNEHHDLALEALAAERVTDLLAHVELECYSVLTRLPEPFRAEPVLVAEYLRRDFPGKRLVLPGRERRELLSRFAALSISGSSVYDAMAAATAAHHGHSLLSCDRRAASVYSRLDAEVSYL